MARQYPRSRSYKPIKHVYVAKLTVRLKTFVARAIYGFPLWLFERPISQMPSVSLKFLTGRRIVVWNKFNANIKF
jgi:hypothetical protein